jgi:hypothetical protein
MRAFYFVALVTIFSAASFTAKADSATSGGNQYTPVPGYESKTRLAADVKIKKRKPKLLCIELGGTCNTISDCCSDATYCSFAVGCSLGTKCCN